MARLHKSYFDANARNRRIRPELPDPFVIPLLITIVMGIAFLLMRLQ